MGILIQERNLFPKVTTACFVRSGQGQQNGLCPLWNRDELATGVTLLLNELRGGIDVQPQPPGANIDLNARRSGLNVGLAIEVTGTKDVIRKNSNKVAQAGQYINERIPTPEENDRLVIVANSQYRLDAKQRNREGHAPDVVKLLDDNAVLMITTTQLYE